MKLTMNVTTYGYRAAHWLHILLGNENLLSLLAKLLDFVLSHLLSLIQLVYLFLEISHVLRA
jgi:hypothetical protein